MSTVSELTSPPPENTKSVLLFWTSWHQDSAPGGSTSKLFETLASSTSRSSSSSSMSSGDVQAPVSFYRIEAEQNPSISSKYNVTIVPTFVFINARNIVVDTIEGMDDSENVSKVTNALQSLIQSKTKETLSQQQKNESNENSNDSGTEQAVVEVEQDPKEALNQRLKSLISSSQIMLFMKGSPSQPKCGFSRQAVEILSSNKLIFGTFDILSHGNEDVRQGLKVYSDWPTYPQLYANGELLGGLDILKEMVEESEGDLVNALGVDSSCLVGANADTNDEENDTNDMNHQPQSLESTLKGLINRSNMMLFMKGLPSQPRCGFSRQICELLTEQKIQFDAFDILSDEEVRQGLKTYSDWPTYPQLYVGGELVGGLDIVKELAESGELQDMISS